MGEVKFIAKDSNRNCSQADRRALSSSHDLFPSPLRGRIKEGGIAQGFDNHVNHSIHVLKYIVIPKSQDIETLIPQPDISLNIVSHLLTMLSAVDLNDQSFFQTNKIDDVASQRLLAAKLNTVNLPESEFPPKQPLSVRGVFPQLPC
jgi:hypothetical protein